MSVRAYKVNKIEHERPDTFNLWDDKISDWLVAHTEFFSRLDDSGGMSGLDVGEIKRLLNEVELDKDTRKMLEKDIEGKEDCEWIDYICF